MNIYGPLSPAERTQLATARRRKRLAAYEREALPSVRREMREQRGHIYYNISYEGDKVTVKADGASVASVTRALAKHHFTKKNRHKTKAVYGGGRT